MSEEDYFSKISEIVERHLLSGDFWSCEVLIPDDELSSWLCMRKNPKHFTPAMFLGTWSVDGKHPKSSPIRLVRAMEMPDDSLRIIGRQGDDLYVLILSLAS